jgi:sec-independent protein translocase protein TatA
MAGGLWLLSVRSSEVYAMGGLSIWHWLIVGAVVLIVFGGKGKISDIMGDVAKGIKSFKKGLAEEDEKPGVQHAGEPPVRAIDHQSAVDQAKATETRRTD